MKEEHVPHESRGVDDHAERQNPRPASLTDLIDELDRAAFHRSLAGRTATKHLEINFDNLQPQPKR
jgi:hypothetical protein